jgi:hypothetical protein
MKRPSREELITLCEKAVVSVEKWENRDTPAAQEQIGICWAYLKAGCEFEVIESDAFYHQISIFHPTFHTIESQQPMEPMELEETSFYVPTQQRIESSEGDWY